MLHSVKALEKCSVYASDGEVGKVSDVYFDDEHWVARYLVADAGSWLSRHAVLLSPMSITGADWSQHRIRMDMDRSTIENSPSVLAHEPVSRRMEASLASHYGLPYYWSGGGGKPMFSDDQKSTMQHDADAAGEDSHLRSCREVSGYAIGARDGKLGHVVDFLFDQDDWSIQYLVVDPVDLWPGKHVLLPVGSIDDIDWSEKKVSVELTTDQVKNSPAYDPDNLPPSAPRMQAGGRAPAQPRV